MTSHGVHCRDEKEPICYLVHQSGSLVKDVDLDLHNGRARRAPYHPFEFFNTSALSPDFSSTCFCLSLASLSLRLATSASILLIAWETIPATCMIPKHWTSQANCVDLRVNKRDSRSGNTLTPQVTWALDWDEHKNNHKLKVKNCTLKLFRRSTFEWSKTLCPSLFIWMKSM